MSQQQRCSAGLLGGSSLIGMLCQALAELLCRSCGLAGRVGCSFGQRCLQRTVQVLVIHCTHTASCIIVGLHL